MRNYNWFQKGVVRDCPGFPLVVSVEIGHVLVVHFWGALSKHRACWIVLFGVMTSQRKMLRLYSRERSVTIEGCHV